jgi:hypothetical protein
MEWSEKQILEDRVTKLETIVNDLCEWVMEIGDDITHRTAGVIPISDYRPQEAQHGN